MTGRHQVVVKNVRLQYKFTIERNITILHGDSATGKTTLIDMISAHQQNGENSGVTIFCDKKCVVLTSLNWELNLSQIKDSIVFIDEGDPFVKSEEFACAIKNTDNYYVIATRAPLFNLPYSINEIYGIKNTAGNRYQGTKRLFSEFYPLHKTDIDSISAPQLVIVEDSHSGYEFYNEVFNKRNIECVSAHGKSNIYKKILQASADTILVIADGAAFGCEIERVLSLSKVKNVIIYLPESFEWIILSSGLVSGVADILDSPYDHIESKKYFSWEQYFHALLVDKTKDTYLSYTKNTLNSVYLHKKEFAAIMNVLPELL